MGTHVRLARDTLIFMKSSLCFHRALRLAFWTSIKIFIFRLSRQPFLHSVILRKDSSSRGCLGSLDN